MRIVIDGLVTLENIDDGGRAVGCGLDDVRTLVDDAPDETFFIRLQSWLDDVMSEHEVPTAPVGSPEFEKFFQQKQKRQLAQHSTISRLIGKNVRVTIEVIDGNFNTESE
jgi:hypothetical protein